MLLKKNLPLRRNAPCPCGSGKKLKYCCLPEIKEINAAINVGVPMQTIEHRRMFNEPLI